MSISRFRPNIVLLALFALVVFLLNSGSIRLLHQSGDPVTVEHFRATDSLTSDRNHPLHRRISRAIAENQDALRRRGEFPVVQQSRIETTSSKQTGIDEDPGDERRVRDGETGRHTSEVETKSETAHPDSNAAVDSALSDVSRPLPTEVSGTGEIDFHEKHENSNLLPAQVPCSSTSTAERFMLVTGERPNGCKTEEGSYLIMKSYKNKVDYCNLHGCRVWYMLEIWNQEFAGTWARYPALLRLMLSNPSIRWFMWMDADAILTDLNFSIPFEKYDNSGKELVFPGYMDKVYGEEGDWISLNAGVFLIRNTVWGRGFLKRWMAMGEREGEEERRKQLNEEVKNRPKDYWVDDQSAALYLLRKDDGEGRRRVHIEAEYVLHGYFDMMVDRLEELEKEPPFVTHFCGCNFCGGATPKERCTAQFRRALNFADNQLLARRVGLRHPALNSSAVVPAAASSD